MLSSSLLKGPAKRLAFPANLERPFREEYYNAALGTARVAAILAIAVNIVFGILDLWIIPHSRVVAWGVRFGVICPVFALLFAASFIPYLKRRLAAVFPPFAFFAALVGGVGIVTGARRYWRRSCSGDGFHSCLLTVLRVKSVATSLIRASSPPS
jgi:branched-subunit amino acid ABC-type transport system permease component